MRTHLHDLLDIADAAKSAHDLQHFNAAMALLCGWRQVEHGEKMFWLDPWENEDPSRDAPDFSGNIQRILEHSRREFSVCSTALLTDPSGSSFKIRVWPHGLMKDSLFAVGRADEDGMAGCIAYVKMKIEMENANAAKP